MLPSLPSKCLPRDAISTRYMLWLCVRLTNASIVPYQLNVRSRKQRRAIAQGLHFSDATDLGEIPTGSFQIQTGRQIQGCRLRSAIFDQYIAISKNSEI